MILDNGDDEEDEDNSVPEDLVRDKSRDPNEAFVWRVGDIVFEEEPVIQ